MSDHVSPEAREYMQGEQYHDLAGPAGVTMTDAAATLKVSIQVFQYHLKKAVKKFRANQNLRELLER